MGYLKTRIPPSPSKSPVWCPKMTNDTSLESSYARLLDSEKNLKIWRKFFFLAKSSCILKMFSNKKCAKPLTMPFQIGKNFCNQCVINAIIAQIYFDIGLCYRLSKKLKIIKIWQLKVCKNKNLVCYMKSSHSGMGPWGLKEVTIKARF